MPPPLPPQRIKTNIRQQNELLERACAYLSEPTPSSFNSTAFDRANTLDRLDPTILYAKKAINDILFDAELGNFNRFSVKINEPGYLQSPRYSNTWVSSPSNSNIPVTSLPAPAPTPKPEKLMPSSKHNDYFLQIPSILYSTHSTLSYILHIPSRDSVEYTAAGSLFAQFEPLNCFLFHTSYE